MEITRIEADVAEDGLTPEADSVSISSTNSTASTKSDRKGGRKLLSRLRKVLTKSQYNLTVEEQFACANIARIPAESSDTNPYSRTPIMKRNKTGTMMEYRETLQAFISQRIAQDLKWNGQFVSGSHEKKALDRLRRDANLSKLECAFIHWEIVVAIYTNLDYNLNALVLSTHFDKTLTLFQNWSVQDEGYEALNRLFWNKTNSLIEAITAHLMRSARRILELTQEVDDIHCCVGILHLLKTKNLPELTEQLKTSLEEIMCTFLKEADAWFTEIYSGDRPEGHQAKSGPVAKLIETCKTIINHIKLGRAHWTGLLFQHLDFNLFGIFYSVWDEQFARTLHEVIPRVVSGLKSINIDERTLPSSVNNADFAVEEDAYKLFIMLREFSSLGAETERQSLSRLTEVISTSDAVRTVDDSYHHLFVPFVVEWINIIHVKNLVRTRSAVNLDDLSQVTDSCRFSSSLVDVASFLLKINDFWEEQCWPTPEESYSFVLVIIKNLAFGIRSYSDLIWERVRELEKADFERFEASDKLYVALNNIEELQRHAECIIQKLNVPRIISAIKVGDLRKQCSSTVSTLVENMQQVVGQQMVDIITSAWLSNMEHMFLVLLDNCAETKSVIEFSEQKSKLMANFSKILVGFGQNVSATTASVAYRTLWTNMISSFEMYLESCKRVDNPPLIFQYLQIVLFDLEKKFQHEALKEDLNFQIQSTDRLLRLKSYLRLHGSSTTDLEIEYLTIRLREQCNAENSGQNKIGRLGVVAKYSQDEQKLHLDILHAVFHNDVPPTYVKFEVIIRNGCLDAAYYYTDYKSSKCQLFEKEFMIDIPSEVWAQGGIVRFWIKHRGRLHARTHVLAEAFLALKSIPVVEHSNSSSSNPLQKVTLTYPTQSVSKCEKCDILNLLQDRKSDKVAVKFVKRERCRFGVSSKIFIE